MSQTPSEARITEGGHEDLKMQVVDYEANRIAEEIIKLDLIRGEKAKYVKKNTTRKGRCYERESNPHLG